MSNQQEERKPLQGKTYSLYGSEKVTDHYYSLIRELTDSFLLKFPDEIKLLRHVQNAGGKSGLVKKLPAKQSDKALLSMINNTLESSLLAYTTGVSSHMKNIPISQKLDPIIKTKEYQYHLYMIEIELINRIYGEDFKDSKYKFALIAHCLRDFRPECKSSAGDYESICKGCTKDCFVRLGSVLLKRFGIHPYISVSMDLEKLFKKIKSDHGNAAALGIACVPELAMGMRLCIKLGIPPIGIPLDANRCARWMNKTQESSFSIQELEKLVV